MTMVQMRAEIDAIGRRLDREMYNSRGFGWHVVGIVDDLTAQVRPALWILMGAAGLVLLIACANVASLFLVRAVGRRGAQVFVVLDTEALLAPILTS